MILNIKIEKTEDRESLPWKLLLSADPSKKMIDKYINSSDIYIALMEEEVVGEYVLTKIDNATVELISVAVDEKFQGRGIGKILVLDAIKKSKEKGFKTIEIGTGNSSFSQLALYQKCGFRVVGVKKDFFTENYDKEIIENGIRCTDMIRLSQILI